MSLATDLALYCVHALSSMLEGMSLVPDLALNYAHDSINKQVGKHESGHRPCVVLIRCSVKQACLKSMSLATDLALCCVQAM